MITLAILNFIVDVFSRWVFYGLNFLVGSFSDATTYLSGFSVPQTILDFLSLSYYFLPMGTITILLSITIIILIIKTGVSIIHVLSAGIFFGE